MNRNLDTTAADINMFLSKKSKSITDSTYVISGKINPIADKREMDLISGGLETWGQLWGEAWFAVAW
jgi:hypothetical protein